ncbi:endonuclease/exonuclease/phosphatase family protein [Nocardioides stalactiti]|uniref:endonuclease/exonuclease/phosphatase family protein n=1 Tax=Nocardioides stalactiti TaxID=2755356 RepID=UPI00160023F1|nr:endonuclease/exonuclease/phosphatase family protein [Nocardioides stalactiti]
MRIGTWNLDARGTARHREFLEGLACDVLLLTEVHPDLELPGMVGHHTFHKMARGQSWAAIYARDLWHLPDPHPASALAIVDGIRVCSSVLPWRGCAGYFPWGGDAGPAKTAYAIDNVVLEGAPDIWGGDWNTSFAPKGYAVSPASRTLLRTAARQLRLTIATDELSNQDHNDQSIDHIAVPDHWTVRSADRVRAQAGRSMLSDHDAYVVDVAPA